MRRVLLLCLLPTIAGCGTVARGTICGQPFSFWDAKGRSTATIDVVCPGGGGAKITSTDSQIPPELLEQQARVLRRLDQRLDMLLPSVPRVEEPVYEPQAFRPISAAEPAAVLFFLGSRFVDGTR